MIGCAEGRRMEIDLHILVTFDENYILPFKTMVKSLVISQLEIGIKIWLIYENMEDQLVKNIEEYCRDYGSNFEAIEVPNQYFKDVKVTNRYPKAMYYRLLAADLLPDYLNRIIYLDPDTLIINSLKDLWETDLGENTFAAASHTGIGDLAENVHKIRLSTDHVFFNTGIILMDLDKARKLVNKKDVFQACENLDWEHVFPDQDLFNILYGNHTLQISDDLWNYDARFYAMYLLRSGGDHDLDWVMKNTSILHFCGKNKPWQEKGYNYFSSLYKHFMNTEFSSFHKKS